jgi:hypothetical protein
MARVRSLIPVRDEERTPDGENDRIWCHWADCDNPGSGLHYMIECGAARGVRDGRAGPPGWWLGPHGELPPRRMCSECRVVTFCAEQCKAYYLRSHRPGLYGKLPPGVSRRYWLT